MRSAGAGAGKLTLAVVHNNIDSRSSIGAIAAWQVREALDRDWRVVAVCRDLDPELAGSVIHNPLYVPPKAHLLQYSVARPTVRAALRGASYDVLLVHQPQLAAIADVWNVHYLSRAARQAAVPVPPTVRDRVHDFQGAGVAWIEDRYLRHLPSSTRVLFCSDGLRDHFQRLFGPLPNSDVLYNPALLSASTAGSPLPSPQRREAFAGDHTGPVIGFLGGGDPRKGGDRLLTALAREPDLFLVWAGGNELLGVTANTAPRVRALGYLTDVTELLDGIDALVVPSRFEPFGMVVVEAVARGVPVVVTPEVGTAQLAVDAGAAAVWDPDAPLGPVVRELFARREQVRAAGRVLSERLAPAKLADRLFGELTAVTVRKQAGSR